MAETWAISALDLHLDLSGTRVRSALESALRDAVTTGRLAPDTKLPSSRALAGDLGVARNTVADAYGQLVAEGWLIAQVGSGTRVATQPRADTAPATRTPTPKVKYDLRAGAPTLTAFPRTAWLTAARKALTTAPADTLGYTDPRGQPALRQALAGYLARARGVRVTPENMVICSGFTQALGLLSEVLAARGHTTMAIEAYGHHSHRTIPVKAGLRVTTIPVDDEGADVDDRADCVLLTPAHQFPLGVPLAAHRRATAAARPGLVIEDDYDGEFRYDRHPVGALQALAPDHVIYAGTASKSLAPGIRLAWLVLPPDLVDEVAEAKYRADLLCGAIDQLTLAEFIWSGDYDRHIRRCRLAYRRRRDRLITELRRTPVTGVAAGLHAVVELPDGVTEDDVTTRALDHGLALEGLSEYHRGGRRRPPALVVGYATPTDPTYTAAIARLGAVLAERPKQ
ncbi:MAG TPA: PLP-dependent aminotransferase family protein [Pseudonocardiaceae bacterium]